MPKICLFAGTTEGRRIAEFLEKQEADLMVCVATEYGAELLDADVYNEYEFLRLLKDVAGRRNEYNRVADAMESVQMKGYGLVMPEKENITLFEPELIKHGSKYGIKIKANAPSLHFHLVSI